MVKWNGPFRSDRSNRAQPRKWSTSKLKVGRVFRNFSGWTEPIHSVSDGNFRKVWLNGSRPSNHQRLIWNVNCITTAVLKPGFHMSGKSQTVWDFTVSRPSQILPTNENSKSYISPIVWDERGQIWRIGSVSIFPTRPRFLRWSAIIPDK